MRWKKGKRSANLEDRRHQSGGGRFGGRFGGRRVAPLGLGGLALLFVLSVIFEQDFFTLLDAAGGMGGDPSSAASSAPSTPPGPAAGADPQEELEVDFVSFVLDDAQAVWHRKLPALGESYRDARLVLFRDGTRSGCGAASAASGPFYCPADEKIYLDMSFFDELHRRFGAPGDFARAYVVAHEIAHHVQNVLGIERQVREVQRRDPRQRNDLSVRMELQADCLAGVWAHSTQRRDLLERGDFEEAMGAAAAVGDDRIQQQATGQVRPDSFTHGTSEQRMDWFRRGFSTGDPDVCDTFSFRG